MPEFTARQEKTLFSASRFEACQRNYSSRLCSGCSAALLCFDINAKTRTSKTDYFTSIEHLKFMVFLCANFQLKHNYYSTACCSVRPP